MMARGKADPVTHNSSDMKAALLYCIIAAAASSAAPDWECTDVALPDGNGLVAHKARVCYKPTLTTPSDPSALHVFGHGDGGGGPLIHGYDRALSTLTDAGFVVASYLSCWVDTPCGPGGSLDFLEFYKTIVAIQGDSELSQLVNFDVPVTLSGHSSGARAVLMAAALKENPNTFMQDYEEVTGMSDEMKAARDMVGAVVANHPDAMYLEKYVRAKRAQRTCD
jgi:hypothetical protein